MIVQPLTARPRQAPRPTASRRASSCSADVTPESVRAFRKLTKTTARQWALPDDTVEVLTLIVSELVTNVLAHSGSDEVAVLLVLDHENVQLEVKDHGTWQPRHSDDTPSEDSTSGRGLQLIQALTTTCGIRHASPDAKGTSVWAQISVQDSS
ncbi:ATP-binding protein [Streptomyces luomodiensis]|uniref:ATP-binding protein n=1 Tax=Streptomyces luomodiensis TaxID=3026192 RepID=A0ABY9UPN2_9ACTN|nr:ATP-binding protein [Streptomyces sp. SCA4-21]WNE93952.1 ATP-binding protein [Streptomyces sp. SCA4-21]